MLPATPLPDPASRVRLAPPAAAWGHLPRPRLPAPLLPARRIRPSRRTRLSRRTAPVPKASAQPLLSLVHAAKAFGAVHAVVDTSIDLYGGEAHALVGENGAGKLTVVKILAGVHQPDEGQLLIEGQPVTSGPTRDSAGSARSSTSTDR